MSLPKPGTPLRDLNSSVKRKAPSEEPEHQPSLSPTLSTRTDARDAPKEEYQAGRVICEICGIGVSFRDERTGGFTLKQWNEHRLTCAAATPSHTSMTVKADTPAAERDMIQTASHPPVKRRRAKRTEEERIEYLKEDPYVAKFEAYRVLCGSCNKWIRLRPNSTFCSIPWDAHRKSCLSKKTHSTNLQAVEERNTFFSQDPYVRKFDAERVLCNKCDRWISMDAEDHAQAVQTWVKHRDVCQESSSNQRNTNCQLDSASAPAHSIGPVVNSTKPVLLPSGMNQSSSNPDRIPTPSSPPFYDLNPTNYGTSHDSRRRNAEQRAATLRADNLISEVEPNRVFCSLCQKWVQLRQDSSYCAYPWLQHRGKCLARHQRRAQNVRQRKTLRPASASTHGQGYEEAESEDEVDTGNQVLIPKDRKISHHRRLEEFSRQPILRLSPIKRRQDSNGSIARQSTENNCQPKASRSTSAPPAIGKFESEDDMDIDADAEGESYIEEPSSPCAPPTMSASKSRPVQRNLADLDSAQGRKNFLFASVAYLFRTTYEAGVDDMSISSLLAYLNAAVPPDKFEDFDTHEVVRGVVTLQKERPGWVKLEGDILKVVM